MQVLQQHPGLLYGAPQLSLAQVHLHAQRRSAVTPETLWLSGEGWGGGGFGGRNENMLPTHWFPCGTT